jgi:hypothetical protein
VPRDRADCASHRRAVRGFWRPGDFSTCSVDAYKQGEPGMPNPNDELARLADAVNDHDHALKTGTSILSYNKGHCSTITAKIAVFEVRVR